MNLDKLLVIIKREYLTRLKSKGFIIGTIVTPLLMASLLLVPVLLMRSSSGANYRLAVLDQTPDSELYERAAGILNAANETRNRVQV